MLGSICELMKVVVSTCTAVVDITHPEKFVTVVFDNSDRASSPVGLENCKQITVTRQVGLVSTVLQER